MLEYVTTRELAEQLGVQEWEIENALRRREVDRPPVVGGVRLWDATRVEQLREALTRRGRTTHFAGAGAPAVDQQ